MAKMTVEDATNWVNQHGDSDDLDPAELEQSFHALYDRACDEQDEADGLWSLCCAAVTANEQGQGMDRDA